MRQVTVELQVSLFATLMLIVDLVNMKKIYEPLVYSKFF